MRDYTSWTLKIQEKQIAIEGFLNRLEYEEVLWHMTYVWFRTMSFGYNVNVPVIIVCM